MAGKSEAEKLDDDPFSAEGSSVMGDEDWRAPVQESSSQSSDDTKPSYQDHDVLPPQRKRRGKPFRHRRNPSDDAEAEFDGWTVEPELKPEPPMSVAMGETRVGNLLRELRANLGEPGKPRKRKTDGE